MDRQGDEVHVTDTEASGGSKPGVVRWVLGIGLVLAVVFMTIIWVTGAATSDGEDEISVSNQIQAENAEAQTDTPIAPDFEQATDETTSQDGLLAVEKNPATVENEGDASSAPQTSAE